MTMDGKGCRISGKSLIQRRGQNGSYDWDQGRGGGDGSDEMWSIHCD